MVARGMDKISRELSTPLLIGLLPVMGVLAFAWMSLGGH